MRTPSDWNGFPKGLESAFSLGSSAEPSAHEPARHLRERCSVAFGAGSRYDSPRVFSYCSVTSFGGIAPTSTVSAPLNASTARSSILPANRKWPVEVNARAY